VNCGKASISTTSLSKTIARIKRLTKPGMGFFSFETAWRTLQGYEGMNMLRKGQIRGVQQADSSCQAAFIAKLFGI
jgi:transposase, IS6 family